MTLYTSDINIKKRRIPKTAFIYLLLSIFCGLFGAIYELYSHEVYSFYMIYAFAFPLVGGVLPFCILNMARPRKYPNSLSRNLYHSGIAALTVGSIVRGVLDIYGTDNALTKYYLPAGAVLIAAGIAVYLAQVLKKNR